MFSKLNTIKKTFKKVIPCTKSRFFRTRNSTTGFQVVFLFEAEEFIFKCHPVKPFICFDVISASLQAIIMYHHGCVKFFGPYVWGGLC